MKTYTLATKNRQGKTLTFKIESDSIEQAKRLLGYLYPRYRFKEIK